MMRVVFTTHTGEEFVVTPGIPTSLMRAALDADVPGIVAECGGYCSCATCHVYVDAQWVDRLPPPDASETGLLEAVAQPKASSRLSCQIELCAEFDGLSVRIPESQY